MSDRKRKTRKSKMSGNRMTDAINKNGAEPIKGRTKTDEEPKDRIKVALTSEQSIAVQLIQEKEKRQATILKMNDLLNELDKSQAENVVLRRSLFQEWVNEISQTSTTLREKYELPEGNADYSIEDGKMFLLKDVNGG